MTTLMTARLSLSRPAPVDIDTIGSIHTDPVACAHNPSDLLASRDDAPALFRRWDTLAGRSRHLSTPGWPTS